MTVPASERPDAKTCDTEGCNMWKMGDSDYCYNCTEGENGGGAPEGNQNAATHHMYSSPEYIAEKVEEGDGEYAEYQDMFIAFFEALCTRHREVYGSGPNDFFKSRYRRYVVYDIQERLGEAYMEHQAEINPLIERQVRDIDGPMEVEAANKLLSKMVDWSREIRLGMKDFGLLDDPESRKASAMSDMAQFVARRIDDE